MVFGLLTNLEFASVGMSRRTRIVSARWKAPTIIPSRANSSSNDNDTVLASLQVVQTLQRHFDRGGDDLAPSGGSHIAYCIRSQCSVEMANASS